jgi:hypothetical protein
MAKGVWRRDGGFSQSHMVKARMAIHLRSLSLPYTTCTIPCALLTLLFDMDWDILRACASVVVSHRTHLPCDKLRERKNAPNKSCLSSWKRLYFRYVNAALMLYWDQAQNLLVHTGITEGKHRGEAQQVNTRYLICVRICITNVAPPSLRGQWIGYLDKFYVVTSAEANCYSSSIHPRIIQTRSVFWRNRFITLQ